MCESLPFESVWTAEGPSLQAIALAASKSGANSTDIQQLASLGNFGRSSEHIASQVITKYCQSGNISLPEPYFADIPVCVKTSDDWTLSVKPVAMYLPHEWFGWLQMEEQAAGFDCLEGFWAGHCRTDPKLDGNPASSDPGKYLPLILHGDGGAFQKSDSIIVLSMRSLLSASNVAHSQMLLVAIPKSAVNKSPNPEEDTMTCLWNILVWSLSYMFFGKHPEQDHQGREWHPKMSARAQKAGSLLNSHGLCGMVFAISADGEFFQNEFRLPGSSHANCCWSCAANKSDCPHNDYRPGAEWRKTLRKLQNDSPTDHQVMAVPGINGCSFHYDSLHVLELGVASHIVANIMFDLVIKSELPGGSQEIRLKELFKKILQQYQELGIDSSNQIRRLTLSTFCKPHAKHDSFPELSGIKAKEVRYLISPMAQICKDLGGEQPYKQHRVACISHLEKMYDIMDSQGLHPDLAAYKKYIKIQEEHRVVLAALFQAGQACNI